MLTTTTLRAQAAPSPNKRENGVKESTRKHYWNEILRVLRENGSADVEGLAYRITPSVPGGKVADVMRVLQVRRELEAEGIVHVRKDYQRRNHPLIVELVPSGPRMVDRVRISVDVIGLPPGSVSAELCVAPTDVHHLDALAVQVVRKLAHEHPDLLRPVVPPHVGPPPNGTVGPAGPS